MSTGSTTAEASRRFSRDVLWTMGVRLAIVASSMLTGIIVARWLGAGAVGVLAALTVVTMLAITVGSLGMPSAITYRVARDNNDVRSVLVNGVLFGMISGVIVAGLLFAIAAFSPQLFGDVPATLVVVVAAAVPVQMITALCMAIYLGLEKIRAYNAIDLALQVAVLMNSVITLIVLGAGLYTFVIVSASINVAIGLIVLLLIDRQTRHEEKQKPDRVLLGEMLRTGSKFFVAMAAGLIILRGDLLIVNYFRGSEEAGVYAVATQVVTFLHMIPNVISTMLFPRTAGAGETSAAMTCRVTRTAVFIMILICLAAIPLALLLPTLYGEAFAAVPMLFLILLPGVFLLGIETIQVQHFSGIGLPRIIPAFWLVVMALNLTLNLLLIPQLGATGAAITSTVSYIVIFAFVSIYFRTKTGLGFREAFLPRPSELKELAAFARPFSQPNEGNV